jgi:Na+/citrate or Na+/malate symporter
MGRVRALVYFAYMILPFILITVAVIKFLADYLIFGFILGTLICKTAILYLYPIISAKIGETRLPFGEEHADIKERIIKLA